MLLLLAAVLPALLWDPAQESLLPAYRGAADVYALPQDVAAARAQGLKPNALDAGQAQKLPTPGVDYRMNVASASTAPWVNSNGWRMIRQPDQLFLYEVDADRVPLAVVESYVHQGRAVIKPVLKNSADADTFARRYADTLAFLKSLPEPASATRANIAFVDDGTQEAGEVMNLLVRRNLMFQPVKGPVAGYDLTVRLGTAEFPRTAAANPSEFAYQVRRKLSDDRRLLRLYGSEVVVGRLTGDGAHTRVHLINYSNREVEGLRVRVLGHFRSAKPALLGVAEPKLEDLSLQQEAVEFSLPKLGTYAVIDLSR